MAFQNSLSPQRQAWLRSQMTRFIGTHSTECVGCVELSVELTGEGLNSDDAAFIVDELELMQNSSPNLKLFYLNLGENKLGPEAAAAIANALTTNAALKYLQLYSCELSAGAAVLARAVTVHKALKAISLAHNCIGSDGAVAFAEALKENRSLEVLVLKGNDNIGDIGATAFAGALKVNQTLETLDLDNCGIGVVGSVAIANALKQNSTLLELHIGHNNKIGDEGALALAGAIHLQLLWLGSTNITSRGIIAMVEKLKQANSMLKSLRLDDNNVGDVGAAAIASWIQQNAVLTDLHLGKCDIGAIGAVALADAVKKNTTLTILWLWDEGAEARGRDQYDIAIGSIDTTLQLDRADRCILALRNNGNVTSIDGRAIRGVEVAYDLYDQPIFEDEVGIFSSEKARELGESLQGNTAVTELILQLDEQWTKQALSGDLNPILQFIEQSPSLNHLSYFMSKRSAPVNSDVVKRFFEAVANRVSAIDFKLVVEVDWLNDRENLNIFGQLMRKKEHSFSKNLSLTSPEDEEGDGEEVEVLESAEFVASLMESATLESLSFETVRPCAGFLKAWKVNSRKSNIRSFLLKVKDEGTFRQLLDTLPHLVHLEQFRLELVGRQVEDIWRAQQGDWLRALKQNGGLRRVELLVDDANYFSDPQLLESQQKAGVWCERNELLAQMAKPRLTVAATTGATNNNGGSDNNNSTAANRTPLRLCPALFHHAFQCPNNGLACVLGCLVRLEDSIGPGTHSQIALPQSLNIPLSGILPPIPGPTELEARIRQLEQDLKNEQARTRQLEQDLNNEQARTRQLEQDLNNERQLRQTVRDLLNRYKDQDATMGDTCAEHASTSLDYTTAAAATNAEASPEDPPPMPTFDCSRGPGAAPATQRL